MASLKMHIMYRNSTAAWLSDPSFRNYHFSSCTIINLKLMTKSKWTVCDPNTWKIICFIYAIHALPHCKLWLWINLDTMNNFVMIVCIVDGYCWLSSNCSYDSLYTRFLWVFSFSRPLETIWLYKLAQNGSLIPVSLLCFDICVGLKWINLSIPR